MCSLTDDTIRIIVNMVIKIHPTYSRNISLVSKQWYNLVHENLSFIRENFIFIWSHEIYGKPIFAPVEKLSQYVHGIMCTREYPYLPSTLIHRYLPIKFSFICDTDSPVIHPVVIKYLSITFYQIMISFQFNEHMNKFMLMGKVKMRDVAIVINFLKVCMRDIYELLIAEV